MWHIVLETLGKYGGRSVSRMYCHDKELSDALKRLGVDEGQIEESWISPSHQKGWMHGVKHNLGFSRTDMATAAIMFVVVAAGYPFEPEVAMRVTQPSPKVPTDKKLVSELTNLERSTIRVNWICDMCHKYAQASQQDLADGGIPFCSECGSDMTIADNDLDISIIEP